MANKWLAQGYINYLYSPWVRKWRRSFYRPRNEKVLAKYKAQFPLKLKTFTIDEVFGGWENAQKPIL